MSAAKKLLLVFGDIAMLYAALVATLLVRYPYYELAIHLQAHLAPFSFLFLAWLLVFSLFDFYRQGSFINFSALLNRVIAASGAAALVSIVLFYLFQGFFQLTPKTNLAIFTAAFCALDYLWRTVFLFIVRRNAVPIMIIGDSERIFELVDHIGRVKSSGYYVARWLRSLDQKVLKDIPGIIEKTGTYTLAVQPSLTKDAAIIQGLYDLLRLQVTIMNFSDFYELVFERVPLGELEEGWFIEHVVTRRPAYDLLKRLLDFVLSAFIFVVLFPLAVLIAILIALTSRGPALYRQKRMGRNNQTFILYKFRTMTHQAPGPLWTKKSDDRITSLGKFLRATHLDEIPQLWNIVRGDISFTGPRPERTELAERYKDISYYEIRHVVKPGLTGWAQINYRPSTSLKEAEEKLQYDIYYVKNRSFFLDLAIILKTIKYIFTSHQ